MSFYRNLTIKSPREKYCQRTWQQKETICHWGQRKLLLVEIEFLINYAINDNETIVYAGSAPGSHILYLSNLFPNFKWILIDPTDFDSKLLTSTQITVLQEYFTDELAKSFNGKNVLFISDIRTADWHQMNETENELYIKKDTYLQLNWVQLMKPKKAMIKLRLPYPGILKSTTKIKNMHNQSNTDEISMELPFGDILFQPWAPPTSTETRLIILDLNQETTYNYQIYEEQLFYHNNQTRKKNLNIEFLEYLNHVLNLPFTLSDFTLNQHIPYINYDYAIEILILIQYLSSKLSIYKLSNNHSGSKNQLAERIRYMQDDITNSITSSGRILKYEMKPPQYRKKFIIKDHTKFWKKTKQ